MSEERIQFYCVPIDGPTEKQVAAARAVLKEYEEATAKAKAETLVRCTSQVANGKGCGTLTPIKHLTYIQTHWYTAPHGCTGGDYWNQGEGIFVCPKCGKRNRMYATPELEKLKPYFREVQNEHKG